MNNLIILEILIQSFSNLKIIANFLTPLACCKQVSGQDTTVESICTYLPNPQRSDKREGANWASET